MLNWAMISSCPVLYSPAGSVPGRMLVALVSMLVRWFEEGGSRKRHEAKKSVGASGQSHVQSEYGFLTCTARCGAA